MTNDIDLIKKSIEDQALAFPLKTLKEVIVVLKRMKEEDMLYIKEINLLEKIKKYVREKEKGN